MALYGELRPFYREERNSRLITEIANQRIRLPNHLWSREPGGPPIGHKASETVDAPHQGPAQSSNDQSQAASPIFVVQYDRT